MDEAEHDNLEEELGVRVRGLESGGVGSLVSGSGFDLLNFGLRVPFFYFGCRVSGFGCRVPNFGFRISTFEFRVSGFGFRISSSGFRVSGLGFRVSGFG